jgi:hypothetical protein
MDMGFAEAPQRKGRGLESQIEQISDDDIADFLRDGHPELAARFDSAVPTIEDASRALDVVEEAYARQREADSDAAFETRFATLRGALESRIKTMKGRIN